MLVLLATSHITTWLSKQFPSSAHNALLSFRALVGSLRARTDTNQKPLNHLVIHIIMNCFSSALCGRSCGVVHSTVFRSVGRSVARSVMKFWRDALTCSVCLSACHFPADCARGVATTSQVKWFEMLQHVWLIAERSWLGTRVERTGQAQCRASRHSLRLFLLVFKQRLSFLSSFLLSVKRAFNFGVHSASTLSLTQD